MSAPCSNACSPWATTADVCSPCDDYAFAEDILEDSLAVATDLLFEWSGQRFPGFCSEVLRPCVPSCPCSLRRSYSDCPRSCGCSALPSIYLGVAPLVSIESVRIDGVELASSLYRIDEFRELVRLPDADGTRPGWPRCQRLDLASSEEGTFEVEVVYGRMPPPAGIRAAADLGCELALGCQPETRDRCRLSPNVQSLSRQGVTEVFINPGPILEEISHKLPSVGMFLQAYNPNGLQRRAVVGSPDIGPYARRINT